MLSLQQFAKIIGCTSMTAATWYPSMVTAMEKHEIDNPIRVSQFLAQVGHESLSLSTVTENLNYSAQRLMAVWKHRFPSIASAAHYEYAPERLANLIYGGRLGNGPYESGDGWRYRGRGPIQMTGKDNYRVCGAAIGAPLVEDPAMLCNEAEGSMAAAWFFQVHGCNECSDDVEQCTLIINGGLNGLDDRQARYSRAVGVLV